MNLNRLVPGLLVAITGLSVVAVPLNASAVGLAQSTVVSAVPASYTPDVTDGVVYSIGQSASTVVLGGSFTSIAPHGSTATVPAVSLAAFTAGTGALVSTFQPVVNGTVYSVIAGPTPGTVYVGGSFTTIDGVKSKIGLISTTTGALVSGWKSPSINGAVNTLAYSGGRLYVGGIFTSSGNAPHVGLVVVNGTTGAVLPITTPAFIGNHNYGVNCDPTVKTCSKAGTGLKSIDINPAGTVMMAIGNFTSAAGLQRNQIVKLDLTSTTVSVDLNWNTAAYSAGCIASAYDSYMRQVQFSPDGSYFVVVATGGGAGQHTNSDGTLVTCDTAARWATDGSGTDVRPVWVDYTGNDTLLSVAITGTVVYVGGHERWLNNTNGVDVAGEGAVPRPGIAALDPVTGMPLAWNPGRNPRGDGTYALLATSDGLYIGSDQDYVGDYRWLHKKVAFFPLAGGKTLAANTTGTLPGSVYLLGSGSSAATGRQVVWNASSSAVSPSTFSAVDWTNARGAFMVNNEVYYGDTDGNFYERTFNGTSFGPAVAIDPYDDPAWDTVLNGSKGTYDGKESAFYGEMPSLTSTFYSAGRVYYTLSGHSGMYYRYFEPDSGVMGADEFTVTDGQNWSNVKGAFLVGSTLYFADSVTGSLFSVPFVNGQATGTPTVANATINWTSAGAFVYSGTQTAPVNQPPTASFTSSCTGLTCSFDATGSSDPDGTVASYAWTWGDGSSTPASSAATTTHTYASGGSKSVTLTVTDNTGAPASVVKSAFPVSGAAAPVSFAGVSTYDATAAAGSVSVPASTQAGDELLLFESYASTTATATVPAGYVQIGSSTSSHNLTTAVFARTATAADLGASVPVTFSASVSASLTLADYASATGVQVAASVVDNTTATHVSPTLTGLPVGTLAVTFWSDKSTGTTSWTAPATATTRSAVFGTKAGADSALLVDSGSTVSGAYGGLTATTNSTSGSGASWTVALAGS
jgi:hypothetical protein